MFYFVTGFIKPGTNVIVNLCWVGFTKGSSRFSMKDELNNGF
ncbi:hypothetical protein ECTX1999_3663 [Escherichia coli TX1999]|nr:hypothetical protein ECTX1999_3663 [Escherichia coli TX1999]